MLTLSQRRSRLRYDKGRKKSEEIHFPRLLEKEVDQLRGALEATSRQRDAAEDRVDELKKEIERLKPAAELMSLLEEACETIEVIDRRNGTVGLEFIANEGDAIWVSVLVAEGEHHGSNYIEAEGVGNTPVEALKNVLKNHKVLKSHKEK